MESGQVRREGRKGGEEGDPSRSSSTTGIPVYTNGPDRRELEGCPRVEPDVRRPEREDPSIETKKRRSFPFS